MLKAKVEGCGTVVNNLKHLDMSNQVCKKAFDDATAALEVAKKELADAGAAGEEVGKAPASAKGKAPASAKGKAAGEEVGKAAASAKGKAAVATKEVAEAAKLPASKTKLRASQQWNPESGEHDTFKYGGQSVTYVVRIYCVRTLKQR